MVEVAELVQYVTMRASRQHNEGDSMTRTQQRRASKIAQQVSQYDKEMTLGIRIAFDGAYLVFERATKKIIASTYSRESAVALLDDAWTARNS